MPLLICPMAPKFALFTKKSKLPLNKDFKNMFELLQSCAQPSICGIALTIHTVISVSTSIVYKIMVIQCTHVAILMSTHKYIFMIQS